MKKIYDIFNKEIDLTDKCLGCEIQNKNVIPPYGILYETKNFNVMQDVETPIPAFMIIASKKHITSILELSKEEYQELTDLCYLVRETMLKFEDIKDVSIIQKELAPHFHVWLMPRYEWMINNKELGFGYGTLSDFTNIIKYTREHCKDDATIEKVKDCAMVIKEILNK